MANYLFLPTVVSPYTYLDIIDTGLFVGYVTNEGTPYDDKKWFACVSGEDSVCKAGYAEGSLYFFSTTNNQYVPMAATNRANIDANYTSASYIGSNTGTSIYYVKRWSGSVYPDAYPGEPFNNFATESELFAAIDDGIWINTIKYPITYYPTNVTLSPAPTEAAVGDTVIVSAVPDNNYGITDPASQILVTNNDVAVPYTWDATNQRITFTMPEGAVTVTVTASLIPTYPITYRPTRVTLSGPATAAVDSTVNVDCTFPEGYGVKTTDSITVTCNRVPVPFSWDATNQRVTFTMPDPTA